ncbi:MAG: ester cyclase [Acidobacteria bacterium]|nr:ester cyclase [Acidobacteriota bacterium]
MRRPLIVGCFVLASLFLVVGCCQNSCVGDTEQQNMAIIRAAHTALERGDLEGFKALIAPDYVRHCQAMPPEFQELHGTEEFFKFIEEFIVAVPEYEDTLGPMMASGDMVAYVSTMKGVQTGPMGDLPPTGREFTLVNIIIQRLENGKVAETWVSWDNVAFLSQLGHFPPPAQVDPQDSRESS